MNPHCQPDNRDRRGRDGRDGRDVRVEGGGDEDVVVVGLTVAAPSVLT
jgi:hypothetical protein